MIRYSTNVEFAFRQKYLSEPCNGIGQVGKLPRHFTISHKTYYRTADIRTFIQKNAENAGFMNGSKRKTNSISKPFANKTGNVTA